MFPIKRYDGAATAPVTAPPACGAKHKSVEALVSRAEKRFKASSAVTTTSPSSSTSSPTTPSILRSLDQLRGPASQSFNKEPAALSTQKTPDRPAASLPEDEDLSAFESQWGLPKWLIRNLQKELGVERFFGIQRRAIPVFSRREIAARDVCIFAPTGSGKTLAFAVPMLKRLAGRVVALTRALVLLPTRELAQQVAGVLEACSKGSGLKVLGLTGGLAFDVEQGKLWSGSTPDIVVATPGRLVEHLKLTKGFTLQHLQFLVIDEADRLLAQSYQGWLFVVLDAARRPGVEETVARSCTCKKCQMSSKIAANPSGKGLKGVEVDTEGIGGGRVRCVNGIRKLVPCTCRSGSANALSVRDVEEVTLRKVLCSATLTPDPQKFAAMQLERPIYVTEASGEMDFDADVEIGEKFTLPEALDIHMVMCTRANKPLALIQLLQRLVQAKERSLVFTRSVEATRRLHMLLSMFDEMADMGLRVAQLSSSQDAKARGKILAKLAAKKVLVCICSDVVARGIDIVGLENVINYDVPPYVKTFVHRAGRTARAGKEGRCYTMVHSDQARHFRQLLRQVGRKPIYTKTNNDELEEFRSTYETCLAKMKAAAKRH